MTNEKSILHPELSEELAELTGAMFGDGNMGHYNFTHIITICGNLSKDEQYILYLKEILERNFGLKASLYKRQNLIEVVIRSKQLNQYFHKVLGVPFSPKKNLMIPPHIKENPIFLVAFLRGLFDTDGCVILQKIGKYQYLLVRICTMHFLFAKDIKESLECLGIPAYICKKSGRGFTCYDVTARHKNAKLFFEKIGSNNSRNIKNMELLRFELR